VSSWTVEITLGIKAWETYQSEERYVAKKNKASPQIRDPSSRNTYSDGFYFQPKKISRKYKGILAQQAPGFTPSGPSQHPS